MPPKPFIYGMFTALWLALAAHAQADSATNRIFIARAQKAFFQAQLNYEANPDSATNAWQFGRACFDLADLATNDTQRAEVARHGIEACRHLTAREPDSAPGHYYLAMNLGQLAKAKAPSIAAYKLVHEVEREFTTAANLDVQFDHAGPARTLGLLYFQAPGWPFSIGDDDKARTWLKRAAQLAPDYPGNQLVLAEAQLKWRQRDELEATLKKLDAIWPAAQTNLTGENWEQSWQEWDAKRAALKAGFEKLYGPKS
jgi:hypothetical protein